MEKISLAKRGLVLFVGGTGSGKSTSQAACINYRNQHTRGHIITIEDPVEYTHSPKHCIITQREVGIDTASFSSALENAMRQSPDVIQIGEIRTSETMESALSFAETGHLCLATLHANNAYQAVERMSNLYPDTNREQVMMGISLNLRAIISQRLIPLAEKGAGRVAAVEVMICTTFVRDLIMKGEIDRLAEAIEGSSESGMQTFDQSLFGLYEADLITRDDALRNAESASNLGLRFKLEGKDAQAAKNLGSTFENVEVG
jgi:twitching motility protein PilU